MQKVVFCIPSFSHTPCIEFQMAALETNLLLVTHGITTVWRFKGGDPYVHKCRNNLASAFLREHKDATDCFFLDDDVGWEPKAVLNALSRPEDLIVGVYPKKNDLEEWPAELTFDRDLGVPIVQDGLALMSLAPTGFMRIKRHVLERVAEDSGMYYEQDPAAGTVLCWDFFRTGWVADSEGSRMGRWWGEDFFFSVMVRHMGMEVWCDPDIYFTHRGSKAWEGRFRNAIENKVQQLRGREFLQDTPAVRRYGEKSELSTKVDIAFNKAIAGHTDLPEEILTLDGMSGRRYRMFINNIMQTIDHPRYLEIGSYKGSTAISACHNTTDHITCIDNWSLFGGKRQEFIENMGRWCPDFDLIDEDFLKIDYANLRRQKHNVYVYDGSHKEQAQYSGMAIVHPALEDEYLLIVDDWNWAAVRNGTMAGLRDTCQRIVYAIEIRPAEPATLLSGQFSDWHNGYLIAVVQQTMSESA